MTSSSKSGYHGKQKIGTCQGSWVCENKKCCFQSTSAENQPNRVNWKTVIGQNNLKMCSICVTYCRVWRLRGTQVSGFQPIYPTLQQFYHLGIHKYWQKNQHWYNLTVPGETNVKQGETGQQQQKNMAIEDIFYHDFHWRHGCGWGTSW